MWNRLYAVVGLLLLAASAQAQTQPNDLDMPVLGKWNFGFATTPPATTVPRRVVSTASKPDPMIIPTGGDSAPLTFLPDLPTSGDATENPFLSPIPNAEERIYAPAVSSPHTCSPRWVVWGSAEVLLGMGRGVNVPPIVTTGPATAGFGSAGALGQPGTVPLFGGRRMLDDWRAGVRAEIGVWLDEGHDWSATARFYSLFSTSDQLVGGSDGTSVVNLPQFALIGSTPVQFPIYVGFPGLIAGSVFTTAQTTFTGGDLNLRYGLHQSERFRFDLLGGYRQMHLGDELGDHFTSVIPAIAGVSLIGDDSVRTRNNFYGGQVGGVASCAWDLITLEVLGAVALGVNASDLDFSRTRAVSVGGVTVPLTLGGIGGGRTDYFGTVSEGGVKLGLRVTNHAQLSFGYTALYWSNVRRAQEQFTLGPTLTGNTTNYFAHILSWGAEVRY